MNFTQWNNFGYPGQELTPFEPVLARDNLVTLTNYGRLCSILFVITPVCHCLFGFFQPLSTVPLLLAAGAAFFLRWAAQRCLNDPDQLVPRARLLTSLFTLLIFLLGVYYDLLRHPTEINVLICLVMLIQLLLFDARPGHNLTVSLSGLAVVVLWECYVPDPHRLINIMYCFLASLIGLYLAWHKTHNMFGMLLYAQREKAAVEKETSTQAAVSQFQPHFISNMLSTIQILCDDAPAKAKDSLGLFADYMRVSTDAFNYNGLVSFPRELAHARNYAALEQLRFGSKLRGMLGIELAKRIKDQCPQTRILFCTAYSYYALEAYQLHALGYLMKPVDADKLREAVSQIEAQLGTFPEDGTETPGKLVVHTFGNFEVLYNGIPLVFEREKAKELLALLIDRQGLSMTNGEIEAFLWEELHSPQYLQTLFYSLRKTLRGIGFEDLLIRTRNHTSIDVSKLHCDLYEFLKGSADAVNSYAGEYMNNYSWAELTNARLYNGTFSDFVLAAQARPRR